MLLLRIELKQFFTHLPQHGKKIIQNCFGAWQKSCDFSRSVDAVIRQFSSDSQRLTENGVSNFQRAVELSLVKSDTSELWRNLFDETTHGGDVPLRSHKNDQACHLPSKRSDFTRTPETTSSIFLILKFKFVDHISPRLSSFSRSRFQYLISDVRTESRLI